jgi:glucosamine-6-phosphate deaminase
MHVHVCPDAAAASLAAAAQLAEWLTAPGTRTLVAAAGNSPLELYRLIAERKLSLPELHVFALDEYVGVPTDEQRNCANLIRRTVADAWGISANRYHAVSSDPATAGQSIHDHEAKLAAFGRADVVVLGLGKNGHLGFNEPGSDPESAGRVLGLEPISVRANAEWFGGDYAPAQGVTLGLRTLLSARHILVVAFGAAKAEAVARATVGVEDPGCPASYLTRCPDVHLFLEPAAAGR